MPEADGANHPGWYHHMILPNVKKRTCTKLRKFWTVGGHTPVVPP